LPGFDTKIHHLALKKAMEGSTKALPLISVALQIHWVGKLTAF
jgi:hypothetical protein